MNWRELNLKQCRIITFSHFVCTVNFLENKNEKTELGIAHRRDDDAALKAVAIATIQPEFDMGLNFAFKCFVELGNRDALRHWSMEKWTVTWLLQDLVTLKNCELAERFVAIDDRHAWRMSICDDKNAI